MFFLRVYLFLPLDSLPSPFCLLVYLFRDCLLFFFVFPPFIHVFLCLPFSVLSAYLSIPCLLTVFFRFSSFNSCFFMFALFHFVCFLIYSFLVYFFFVFPPLIHALFEFALSHFVYLLIYISLSLFIFRFLRMSFNSCFL